MGTLDLVVWVCTQDDCCWCIFMLHCVHDHRGVIVSIHVNLVTSISPCMRRASTGSMLWRALARPSTNTLTYVVYTSMKPCRCAITHQTRNSAKFSPWKWGTFVTVFSQRKLGENSVLCAMIHQRWNAAEFPPQKLGEMLSDFHRENLEAILNVLAKHWVRPHPLQNQISKPNSFKAPKANANSLF